MRFIIAATITALALQAGMVAGQEASLADRKEIIEEMSVDPTPEQLERKARNMGRLSGEGVPTIDHLPVIESAAGSLRRTEREVAERAIGLVLYAVLGETGDHALVNDLLDRFDAHTFLTPAEHAALDSGSLSQQQRIDASWRYEGVEVLLWSIGLLDALSPTDEVADVPAMVALFRELGTEGILARARLRPQFELLDAADYIYRLHWAVVDARLNGDPPPTIAMPGIVMERHYALNWLIGYAGLDWDNMATDT